MTKKYLTRLPFWAASFLGSLAACQGGEPGRAVSPPWQDTGGPLAPSAEETIGWDSDAAAVRFERAGDGFRGGFQTHQVVVSQGLIELVALEPGARGRRSPSFGLQTVAAWRGEVALDTSFVGAAQVAGNVVETARAALTERLHNTPEGVEQSWRFEQDPGGEGDLIVAIDATGLDFAGSTEGGLHFRRSAGELGFRYSHGTWVEADGDRWAVQAQYDNGRILLAVPAEIIANSAYPAVLDPTVTAEVLTDVPVLGSSGADNANGEIATDGGTGYFAVWQDRRNTRNDDIWGARINGSGVVQDLRGIKIYENATTVESNPVVAWVGTGWVVAWESAGNIAAAFVSSAGAVTQLGTVAGTAAVEASPAIAARGTSALLTWTVAGVDISAALYSAGAFGASFAVAATAAAEKSPAVAANPAGEYLVLFQEGSVNDNIRGQRVTDAGALSGVVFDLSIESGTQSTPAVDFNGTDFVAVWTTSSGTVDLRGARISAAGVVLDASPGVMVSGAADQQTLADLSCGTGACWVSWQDRRNLATTNFDIYGATFSAAAEIGAETLVTTANRAQTNVSSAVSGGQWMTVWTDLRDGEARGMFGTRVSSAGAVMDAGAVQLGRGYDRHASPVVSRTPTIWSVMWGATRVADYDAVHVRYNANGTQLDANPLTISNATASQLPSAAVYSGTNLLAVWTDNRGGSTRDIYGARVNPSTGLPLDASGFAISTAAADQSSAKIATNGTTSLVVWQDRRTGSFDIYAALLNADGSAAVSDLLICANAGDQTRPTVAYDPTNAVYLVAWADANGGATTDIRGARVSAAGALLDAACGATISGADSSQSLPDVAFANGRFLVAWEDRRSDPNGDIYAARVSATGGLTVLDASGLLVSAVAATEQSRPAVAPYGGNFVVAWEDARNLATTKFDIYGTRIISASGVVETPFVIAASVDDERSPDISDGPTATSPAKVAYLRTRLDLDTVRVQVRRITYQTATGASCSSNAQCASGFCVDSKCCNTACGGTTLTDCQACSIARGASADGLCSVVAGPNLTICRNYAQVPVKCDAREYCDGVSAACPPDLGINEGRVCNTTTGTVCPANSAAGAPHLCP